jgi:hypothetical protein
MDARTLVPVLVLTAALGLMAAPGAMAKPPRGYTLVNSPDVIAANGTQGFATVSCPSGLVPLGGSASIHSVNIRASVSSSFPIPGGWTVAVNNNTGSPLSFGADVVCARQPRNYSIVQSAFVQNTAGSQDRAAVDCPRGSQPLGGGVDATSDSLAVNANSLFPSGRTWVARENNASPDANAIAAVAVCGKLPGYTFVFSDPVLDGVGSHTLSFATCPAPTVPVGGGGASNSPNIAVDLGGMGFGGDEFISSMNNASPVVVASSTVVICAGR